MSLNLSGRGLTALPTEVIQATHLQELDLVGNELTVLPPDIGRLTNLRQLKLDNNQLTTLPPEIGKLVNLETLTLHRNHLTALPPEIGQLTNLRRLTLKSNKLTALPPEIGHLVSLTVLSLDDNQLTGLPSEIGKLAELTELELDRNHLTTLPPELGQLANLILLALEDNELTTLPVELSRLEALQFVLLDGNPLDPELEAAVRDPYNAADDLLNYLLLLAQEGEPLFEAKLLLVGEGEVGKSSLLGALRGDPWIEGRDSTHGLEIRELRLEHPDRPVQITLRGWDFGGQAVYRPTHQLFFSAPGLYLVVWKPREGPELNFVEYWIRLIKHRAGPGARVFVVATHRAQGRVARLDEAGLRSAYGSMIAGFHHVDSRSGVGIAELKRAIVEETAALPSMGRCFPRSWRQAWEILRATAEPFLSYERFEAVVAQADLDKESAASFARNSHELGHLIHYGEDPGLADLVVLRPDWLSRAISAVLEDQVTVDNKGLVAHARLAQLWDDESRPADQRYERAVHPSLLRLMEHFDLSYRVETGADRQGAATTSLVAQLVPSTVSLGHVWGPGTADGRSELTEVIEIVDAGSRRPTSAEGLVFQLIVRLHRFSLDRDDYRNAVHGVGGQCSTTVSTAGRSWWSTARRSG